MLQLLTVVGARPQFIKAAALSRAIASSGGVIQEKILHTGQHYDAAMSDQFFRELGIPAPAFHLGMGGGSHGANLARRCTAMVMRLRRSLRDSRISHSTQPALMFLPLGRLPHASPDSSDH